MFTFANAWTVETFVVCLSSPLAPSTQIMVFLLFCDRIFLSTVSIVKVCSDMFITPLDPLSTLCSISLSIKNCSGKGCSIDCCLFLSFSFRSFKANSTTDRPSPLRGMVVNQCSLFTICTAVLAREYLLLFFEVFCLYVVVVSIICTPSLLGCGSSVSTEVVIVCSNHGLLLYPISSSSLKFPCFPLLVLPSRS